MTRSISAEQDWRLSDVARWFGDEYEGVLVEHKKHRVRGRYCHDGHGKWEVWLHVSYWNAWRICRTAPTWVVAWGISHCTVGVFRSKSRLGAMNTIEDLSGVYGGWRLR